MDEGICLVDPDYNIEYANSALVKQFGPYAGQKCYRYCDDRDTVCPWCKIAEVRAGKSARWTWHSSKTEKTFSALAAPVAEFGAGGHVLVVLRDVSEFTRRGQTVHHSRKLVEQIFRESHDVLLIVGEDGEIRKAGDRRAVIIRCGLQYVCKSCTTPSANNRDFCCKKRLISSGVTAALGWEEDLGKFEGMSNAPAGLGCGAQESWRRGSSLREAAGGILRLVQEFS